MQQASNPRQPLSSAAASNMPSSALPAASEQEHPKKKGRGKGSGCKRKAQVISPAAAEGAPTAQCNTGSEQVATAAPLAAVPALDKRAEQATLPSTSCPLSSELTELEPGGASPNPAPEVLGRQAELLQAHGGFGGSSQIASGVENLPQLVADCRENLGALREQELRLQQQWQQGHTLLSARLRAEGAQHAAERRALDIRRAELEVERQQLQQLQEQDRQAVQQQAEQLARWQGHLQAWDLQLVDQQQAMVAREARVQQQARELQQLRAGLQQ
ncbi:hypothetical protein N2152v2_009998 [Parachlorella kessleri]